MCDILVAGIIVAFPIAGFIYLMLSDIKNADERLEIRRAKRKIKAKYKKQELEQELGVKLLSEQEYTNMRSTLHQLEFTVAQLNKASINHMIEKSRGNKENE